MQKEDEERALGNSEATEVLTGVAVIGAKFRPPDIGAYKIVRFRGDSSLAAANLSRNLDPGKNTGIWFNSLQSSAMARVRWGELSGVIRMRSSSPVTAISAEDAKADWISVRPSSEARL